MGFGSIFSRKKKQNPMSNTPDSMASPPVPFHHSSSLQSPIQTRTQLQELEQVFNKLDVNGDGKISSSELCSIMGSLGHSKEELQMMIDDDDGFMNFKQFVELNMKGVESEEVLESLREAFSVYDRDGNGWISAEELQAVLRSLGDEECRKMISGVDRDGNGMIDFEEFKVMMMPAADSIHRLNLPVQGSSISGL